MSEITTQTLASWLLDQIAEDEVAAQAAFRDSLPWNGMPAKVDDGHWRVINSYGEPDEDACAIEGVGLDIYDEGGHSHDQATHIAHNDPAHVLAVCAAHRAIVAECSRWLNRPSGPETSAPENTLHALALAYADREGFREEWRA